MAEYFAQYISAWIANLTVGLLSSLALLALVLLSACVFIWMERKVSARIQDRLGPTRVGGRFGWLQAPADGIKLICKEDIIPAEADRLLFRVAPYISFVTMFAVFMALPWATDWVPIRLDAAVFFIVAVAGLEVFGVILGGYASGSKWSLYGSMREAAQVISYEIPMGLCVVVVVLIAGSMDLVEIGNRQAGWFWNWYLLHDPFTFVTFWIYITCAVAHTNRAPFDLPEAESELVAGFMTEYSGFRWAVFFMAEYGAMLAVSALAAILFLGGWNGPIPIAKVLWLTPETGAVAGFIGNCLGACILLFKAYLGVTFMMWLRWTLPRLRIDQVMTTCLKYCLPLVSAMLAGAMLWTFVLPGGVTGLLFPAESNFQPIEQNSPLGQEGIPLEENHTDNSRRGMIENDTRCDCKLKIVNCKFQIADISVSLSGEWRVAKPQAAFISFQQSSFRLPPSPFHPTPHPSSVVLTQL